MLKSVLSILSILIFLVILIHGNPHHIHGQTSSSMVTFLKPKASQMRRVNPLKLFFTVVHTPEKSPHYSIEWNLPFLKTMLLESTHVSDDDKTLFLITFSNIENDYAQWPPERHDQLERFTEKYFNLYTSPESFLPFLDCTALTYAITDEILNDLQPNIDEQKRAKVRAKSVDQLCDTE